MPVGLPSLTAVVTCRNAAGTLARHLDHLEAAGARVILIDHGSTDRTLEIATERRGAPIVDLVREPFDGTFNLTRQLYLKRQIFRSIANGWIIHADADEFLDTPDGSPLREHLRASEESAIHAFPCDEFVFLPGHDDERHDPARFEVSMREYVHLRERDPKQRLFRAGVPLDLWMATGGHTVTLEQKRLAADALTLRHYPGLSLDHIRAQYLSRVFARDDVTKRWHGHRMGAMSYDIVAPPASVLKDADAAGLLTSEPVTMLPFFAIRKAADAPVTAGGAADLLVVGCQGKSLDALLASVLRRFPGLRVRALSGDFESLDGSPEVPILQVFEHPAEAAASCSDAAASRRIASEWLRRVARTRQIALSRGVAYAEIRVENAGDQEVETAVRSLLLRDGPRGERAFLSPEAVLRSPLGFPEPLEAIAGSLARDLGYA